MPLQGSHLQSPKLHIRSRKAPAPDGFVVHTSNLDSLSNTPFLIHWSHGKIQKILLAKDEPLSIANLKKGIASLFQFKILDDQINETDSSGHCTVSYTSTGANSFTKSKSSCLSSDLPYISNPELILSTNVESSRTGSYEMDEQNKYLKSVQFEERHTMLVAAKEDVGNKVEAHQSLVLKEQKNCEVMNGDSVEEIVDKLRNRDGITFTQESLLTEREVLLAEDAKTFQNIINEYRDNLKTKLLGTLSSAKVIARLISVGRIASKEDIVKTLGAKKNQKILHQLYDILGYVQTQASHDAVMKKLNLEDQKQQDLSERYLWALSMASQPNPHIISTLLTLYQKSSNIPPKVKETLVLTVAAMARRLSKLPDYKENFKVYHNVEEAMLHGLDVSKGDTKLVYLRALKNLKSKNSIPRLLKIVRKGTEKEQVFAWKALRSFEPSSWNNKIINAATTTFFQLDKKYDSSSRTIALDIILLANPSDKMLGNLIYFLISSCKSFEVQQYLVQSLKMISDKDEEFKRRVLNIIRSDIRLNNYDTLAQKGWSTALKRDFLQSSSSNGSLLTVQEIKGGIVKRGIVNIMMEKDGLSQEIFSLGIFSGGLDNIISSDGDPEESEESATAGIELTVLGTQIRPFVFFTGQGELMGHVWSGSASEDTTAYQALAMLHDHQEYLRLGAGFIAELDLKGAISFDLSGKIEISLWNRNAVSLVEKSAGIIILGLIRVDTSFVKSQVEFSVSLEPKLNLQTDIEFSSNVNLCMKLSQPDFMFRHNVFKIERIPGSKHRLRKVKYKKYTVPGKTYSLNKKNNEMCNEQRR
ncbi:hypothetical protein ILUMI_21251 [Ignelater luminosus]|uniref:Vitellogenin domain-containing protein n=1 Tax=Ignelater luminosus TaxID=2038154 RepID=A0A8K0CJ61_IGNLU|nr:hypothetical protein ILUMI_21251 [Ignelater luminosus]